MVIPPIAVPATGGNHRWGAGRSGNQHYAYDSGYSHDAHDSGYSHYTHDSDQAGSADESYESHGS